MPLEHKSIVEIVVEEMERQILNRELKPGQHITEESLTSKWKISRSSLREAFRILESQGFVTHEPRRGIRVSCITSHTVKEVYQVRAALEGLVLELAVQESADEVEDKLKNLNEKMKIQTEKGDLKAYHELNMKFHETLIHASRNEFLIKVLTPINKVAERFRAELFISQGVEKSLTNHEEIILAFENGDPKAAGEKRTKAILEFGEMVGAMFNENFHKE
jgi:DNA-binding GntR family transcriptional regulator